MASPDKGVTWERIVPGDADGKAAAVVDDGTDWDLLVDKYHDAPGSNRTASIVDKNADWDGEVDKYWKPPEPERKDEDEDSEDDMHADSDAPTPEEFVGKLIKLGVKAVAFDLDRTSSKRHSGGILAKEDKDHYIGQASEDFKRIVPLLHEKKIRIAIASFSDKMFYSASQPPEKYLAGEDLMHVFLDGVFGEKRGEYDFLLIGYYPLLHPDDTYGRNKHFHLEKISHICNCEMSEIALFDDTKHNVQHAKNQLNVKAYRSDPKKGFRLNDIVEAGEGSEAARAAAAKPVVNGTTESKEDLTQHDLEDSEGDDDHDTYVR